jgi:hypothetical protein
LPRAVAPLFLGRAQGHAGNVIALERGLPAAQRSERVRAERGVTPASATTVRRRRSRPGDDVERSRKQAEQKHDQQEVDHLLSPRRDRRAREPALRIVERRRAPDPGGAALILAAGAEERRGPAAGAGDGGSRRIGLVSGKRLFARRWPSSPSARAGRPQLEIFACGQ